MHFLQPFRRWSVASHACLATVCVVAVSILGEAWLRHHSLALQAQQKSAQDVKSQWDAASSRREGFNESMASGFPAMVQTDDVVRAMGSSAESHGVHITSLSADTRPATPADVGVVRFQISAQSDYRAGKAWLGELLARYRSMAVQSLEMQGALADASRVDMRLTLAWFVKD